MKRKAPVGEIVKSTIIPTKRADTSAKATSALNKANALGSNMSLIMQSFNEVQVALTNYNVRIADLEDQIKVLEARLNAMA